jgi:arylsulfatase A
MTTMDLLPTFAELAGCALPPRPIDGHDVRPILYGEAGGKSPWDDKGFMYYRMDQLQAVRSGPWKLYLPLEDKYIANNRKTAPAKMELYDVHSDVSEAREVSAEHPDVVARLVALADEARRELGDRNSPGRAQRPAGYVANPVALIESHTPASQRP